MPVKSMNTGPLHVLLRGFHTKDRRQRVERGEALLPCTSAPELGEVEVVEVPRLLAPCVYYARRRNPIYKHPLPQERDIETLDGVTCEYPLLLVYPLEGRRGLRGHLRLVVPVIRVDLLLPALAP